MYNYKKPVTLSYADAVIKVKDELKKEGFGVLTEIDVKQTLKTKLNIDFDDYIILGACNPTLAHEALTAERDIGVLLPCNVIVYVQGGKTFISAVLPTVQLGKVGNPELLPIAEQVESKLKKVVDAAARYG
ncbi:MAG: DUF302 domain-containing protein [Candidatus Methanoperedenaceae archaeon]|nr:DUF302 domain-containing protein [Candidatus Methanoperedenaceae archaeon]